MRNKSLVLAISTLILLSFLSGCIGGDDDEMVIVWDGEIENLLLSTDDLGEDYEFDTDYTTDPEKIDDDPTELEDLGFKEGAMSDFTFWGTENIVIGAQRVLRYDVDKMDAVMDKYESDLELEEDEKTSVEEVDLGTYGDQSLAFKLIDQDSGEFGTYTIGFIKNDIFVFIIVISVEDDGDMIKDITEKIENKF